MLCVIGWLCSLMSIFAYLLCIAKNKYCFVLWTIGSIGLIYVNMASDILSQASLFFVYLALNIYGYLVWTGRIKDYIYGYLTKVLPK